MAMPQAHTVGDLTALLGKYPPEVHVRVQQALSDEDYGILAVTPKRGRTDLVVLIFDLPAE
jgi:hypothetical protein